MKLLFRTDYLKPFFFFVIEKAPFDSDISKEKGRRSFYGLRKYNMALYECMENFIVSIIISIGHTCVNSDILLFQTSVFEAVSYANVILIFLFFSKLSFVEIIGAFSLYFYIYHNLLLNSTHLLSNN